MRLWLTQATTSAPEVDYLILALLLISCAVLALVFGLMLLYVIKYRAGSGIDRGASGQKDLAPRNELDHRDTCSLFLGFSFGAPISTCACFSRRPTR